jgi:choice-of-anchor B domain-containing protein
MFSFKYILLILLIPLIAFSQNYNTHLISNQNSYAFAGYTDTWGYVAPDGREYALLGVNGGVSIVDVSDTTNVTEVDYVPWVLFSWYDMKVYQNYMYVSSEGINEVLIVDLSTLPDSASILGTVGGFSSEPHNIYIDTTMGLLYVVEDFNFNSPVQILSLSNPAMPVEIGNLGGGLGTDAHDVFAQDSVLYVAEGINGSIGIFNVQNPANPVLLQRLIIPSAGYVHNVWASEDNNSMITTEETAGKTVKIWDIRDLNNISLLSEYLGESELVHNAMIKGNYAYMSHYESGLKIIEISDPRSPIEVGSYDTFPASNNPDFNGSWGVYPFTLDNMVFMGDRQTGLYVLKFNGAGVYRLNGILKDVTTSNVIENGWLEIVESGKVVRSNAAGIFRTGHARGEMITLKAVAYGYLEKEMQINAVIGATDSIEILLQPSPVNSLSGTLTNQNGEAISGMNVNLSTVSPLLNQPLTISTITDLNGTYTFNDLPLSDSVWINYPFLQFEKRFPYTEKTVENIVISAASPTIIDLQFEPADLLLVNDDPQSDYMDIYINEFTILGLSPYPWITTIEGEAIPVSSMSQLKNSVIIWYTGDSNPSDSVLTSTAQDSLAWHLDHGGRLLLTSKDLVESLSLQGSAFLSNYLMVDYGGEYSGSPLINPVVANPVVNHLSSFPVLHQSKEILLPLPTGNAEPAFSYISGGTAGVTIENTINNSKIALFGFRLEEVTASTSRNDILIAILSWFDVSTTLSQNLDNTVPNDYRLLQNYPNPFNPTTNIQYHIPRQERVILRVFNLLGQEMTTLINKIQNAGIHTVTWDGRNSNRNPVPSGIYLYQIEAGSFKEVGKMMLIK